MYPVLAHQHELERLCRTFNVRRLELFGSAATGRDCPDTCDLDFLVEFGPPTPGACADTYFGLLEALFARPVDLVVASAIHNPYFRQSVDQSKVLVFAASRPNVPRSLSASASTVAALSSATS